MLTRSIAVFGCTTCAGYVGLALPSWGAHYSMPILPGGIAVAVIYRWGHGIWIAVLAGGMAYGLLAGETAADACAAGVGLAAGGSLSGWLLRRHGFEPEFPSIMDVILFMAATTVGMTVTTAIGFAEFLLSGAPADLPQSLRCLRWWSNAMAGGLLFGPLLIAVRRQSMGRLEEHGLEALLWSLAAATCCAVIAHSPGPVGRSIIVMAAVLVVVCGAIRFGLVPSMLGAVAIASTTAASFSFGFGMFGQIDEMTGLLTLLVFNTTLIGASLFITALLSERDLAALERLRAERRYGQIFSGSPQAIWVHDSRTLAFLLVNEAMQRQYGWTEAELLVSNVLLLAAPGELWNFPSQATPPGAKDMDPVTFETRQMAKDGHLLDVQLWARSIDFGGSAAVLVFAVDISERKAFGRALVNASASEQRRIGVEIHDGLGQELTGLALSLRALATRAERTGQRLAAELDELARLATRCIEGSRRIVQGLSPLNDAGGSLESALASLADRASLSGTPVRFRTAGSPLAADTMTLDHLYRIGQEAVQNALKHARAASVDVELYASPSAIKLSVVDDGCGLPDDHGAQGGLGMRTMQFRTHAIGGTLIIEAPSTGGTAVRCTAPRRA